MIKVAFVIFRDGTMRWNRIFKKGFGHVSVMYKDDFNWVAICPDVTILSINILPYSASIDIIEQLMAYPEFTILEVKVRVSPSGRWWARFMPGFTCVSLTKYYLGLRWLNITPYSLYKRLLRKNMAVIRRK